jgi:2-polyprenyl-6-methoxyphenol hydroxylase-like FAD-dependent oxidoreductase
VIVGGGIAALTTAMLLADGGHRVTVLERDPADPTDPDTSWEGWERRDRPFPGPTRSELVGIASV